MNQRIFIQKKISFDIESEKLLHEFKEFSSIKDLKIYQIYDIFNATKDEIKQTLWTVFADPVTEHIISEQDIPKHYTKLAVEYLPGQYDQRADSAEQCFKLITHNENIQIKSGKLLLLEDVSEKDFNAIKTYYINPVDSHEKDLSQIKPFENTTTPEDVKLIKGFKDFNQKELEQFYYNQNFAFGLDDMRFIQTYFKKENRDPTETELKVLDTYWSDHCRHTTFLTELKQIDIKGDYQAKIQSAFNQYLALRKALGREHKPISLMDLATISAKYFHKIGKLNDLVISDEINACTIEIDLDGEPYYLLFKNETHNHPTEIEPFGGASTCIGGAIRDPLSGRAYVYQAMRLTGAGNPLESISQTLVGKLPQRKITQEAASGYSSYGNQIGLATTQVSEIYHPGYTAKRMEVGMVVGTVPKSWVRREKPEKGDAVIILGGRTGRDGVGGATGSSKVQNEKSVEQQSSEVQKGNAVEERKIQKLFKNPEVTKLIKKSNDFGAGGVSVAIGEIADSLIIDLDKLPVKYQGLNGTELAVSESQERMAVVVENNDVAAFIKLCENENIEAVKIAEITDNHRLEMYWKGQKIVDLSRDFLDSNGCLKQANVKVCYPLTDFPFKEKELTEANLINELQDLNIASQKGLIEMFDSTVGQTTVLMPLGGKNQLTPAEGSVQMILDHKHQVSIATWGFSPIISEWNPYLGGIYAVIESISKVVAIGGNYQKIRFSFQEYFEKLGQTPEKWGKPFAALLGTIETLHAFELAAIGGKDSMSGTFNEINVPPTLISFAVAVGNQNHIISPEFKKSGHYIYLLDPKTDDYFVPDFKSLKSGYDKIYHYIKDKKIVSAKTIKDGGIAVALAKMSFGNDLGVDIQYKGDLFIPKIGSLIIETTEKLNDNQFTYLGQITNQKELVINTQKFDLEKLKHQWTTSFEDLFPTHVLKDNPINEIIDTPIKIPKNIAIHSGLNIKPTVFIPTFPGTNCEYESIKVFKEAGAKVETYGFKNLNFALINQSIEAFIRFINQSQILMFPGGFSAGDEPDGSAKYITAILRNEKIKNAIHHFLEKDGLILGICNGFQALIKSGLLPVGEISSINEDSPTLTVNKIGRHISQTVYNKVLTDNSPWLKGMKNKTYIIPISHGEGQFYAPPGIIKKLHDNGQIASIYVDEKGKPAYTMPYNPNDSIAAIEGIISPNGKIYGKMGHPERYRQGLMKNIPNMEFMDIFKNGVQYFE